MVSPFLFLSSCPCSLALSHLRVQPHCTRHQAFDDDTAVPGSRSILPPMTTYKQLATQATWRPYMGNGSLLPGQANTTFKGSKTPLTPRVPWTMWPGNTRRSSWQNLFLELSCRERSETIVSTGLGSDIFAVCKHRTAPSGRFVLRDLTMTVNDILTPHVITAARAYHVSRCIVRIIH